MSERRGGKDGGSELGKEEREEETHNLCLPGKYKRWVIKLIYKAMGAGNNVILRRTGTAKNKKMSSECSFNRVGKREIKKKSKRWKKKKKTSRNYLLDIHIYNL